MIEEIYNLLTKDYSDVAIEVRKHIDGWDCVINYFNDDLSIEKDFYGTTYDELEEVVNDHFFCSNALVHLVECTYFCKCGLEFAYDEKHSYCRDCGREIIKDEVTVK